MPSIANEKELFSVCSSSLDLVLKVNMVTTSPRTLESILPHVDQSESLDMYSFQRVIIFFDEELLEFLVKVNDHSSLYVSRSLKNETDPPPNESSLLLDIVLETSFSLPLSIDHLPSSLSSELIPISNNESNRVQKKSQRMKRSFGGMSSAFGHHV